MLEEGIAGLVGGSNYCNPETKKRDEKVRCLCPYGRSVTDDKEKYQPFQYSPLEWMLVDLEREAIRERKGMWAAEPHDKSCHLPFLVWETGRGTYSLTALTSGSHRKRY